MIAFGSSITDPDMYDKAARAGFELAKEPDSVVMAHAAAGSIFRSYNLLLDRAAELPDLEALVLVHQDAEIADPDFVPKLREALKDPDVGLVGCVGSIGVRSIAWWEGSVKWASFIHRYDELGGGDFPGFSWSGKEKPAYAETGEVDTIDGFVMCFSPWVVQNVRFDESLGKLHGYDFDFCLTVREAGKKVVTADFKTIHHHSLDLIKDPETWVEAHMRIAEKWDGRADKVGVEGGDWRLRARRAEAEAAVTRAAEVSAQLKGTAQVYQLEKELEEIKGSIGWRITEPLRRANYLRRTLQARNGRRRKAPAGKASIGKP